MQKCIKSKSVLHKLFMALSCNYSEGSTPTHPLIPALPIQHVWPTWPRPKLETRRSYVRFSISTTFDRFLVSIPTFSALAPSRTMTPWVSFSGSSCQAPCSVIHANEFFQVAFLMMQMKFDDANGMFGYHCAVIMGPTARVHVEHSLV